MSVNIQVFYRRLTLRHIPEDMNIRQHQCENLVSSRNFNFLYILPKWGSYAKPQARFTACMKGLWQFSVERLWNVG